MKRLLLTIYLLSSMAFGQGNIRHYVNAQTYLQNDRPTEAFLEIKKAEKFGPDDPLVLQLKGRILARLRHYKEALELVNRAVDLAEEKSFFYGSKAVVFKEMSEWDSVSVYFQKALNGSLNRHDSIAAYCNWAGSEIDRRNFMLGDSLLQLGYAIDTSSIELVNNIAFMYLKTEEFERAIFYLEKGFLIDSADSKIIQNLGYAYQRLGKYKESTIYFDKSILLDPRGAAYPYSNRSYNKLQLGDLDGALEDVNKSIKMDYTNSYAYRNRALIWLAKGEKVKACEDLDKALRFDFTIRYGDEVEKLKAEHCE